VRAPSASTKLLVDFLNTVDVEEGTDVFADGPDALATWLVQNDLCRTKPRITRADLRAAIDLRRGLRGLALANNDEPPDPGDVRAAQHVVAALSFRVDLTGAVLTADGRPVDRALGRLVAAYLSASQRGEWPRVRRCPADDCACVFWDYSKNASRRWCKMSVCGNRAKTRAFAARHASA
jgi:predicted RNA-binding Zn ribbon-like protein